MGRKQTLGQCPGLGGERMSWPPSSSELFDFNVLAGCDRSSSNAGGCHDDRSDATTEPMRPPASVHLTLALRQVDGDCPNSELNQRENADVDE